ncbi:DUF4249 family protein [Sphingobacterium griseoflavum]|nr:hypothetical protein [Sphingobacterium griseoflavum]
MLSRKSLAAIYVLIFVVCNAVSVQCTDHKTTVPFDFPPYVPRLVILSSIGTISGGEAHLFWSKPLPGQAGVAPSAPEGAVYLLQEGARIHAFAEKADSSGYFVLPADAISLQVNTPYAIEVILEESGERIYSQSCFLPEKPVLERVAVNVDAVRPFQYTLSWQQRGTTTKIGAASVFPYLLDSIGNFVTRPRLAMYFRSPEFRYAGEQAWSAQIGSRLFDRQLNESQTALAQFVDVRLAFLSPELSRFKWEVDRSAYLGESIYQTVRPQYSNIIGAEGVFGLYSEDSVLRQF